MALGREASAGDLVVNDQLEPGSSPGTIRGNTGDRMGYSVAHLGEVGGSAHGSDFAVGAPQFNEPNGYFLNFNDTSDLVGKGYVKVFRGQDLPMVRLVGTQSKERFGYSIAGKANVDNDAGGLDEVIVGSPFWDTTDPADNAGKVSVYRGGTFTLLGDLAGGTFAAPSQERLGFGVSGLADFNGGGEEFAVGSFGYESPTEPITHQSNPCAPCPKPGAVEIGGLISGRCQVVTYNGSSLSTLAAYMGDFRDSAGSFVSFLPAAGPDAYPAVVVSSWRWGDSSSPALNEVGRIQLFLWP
jgi:hypothetical protein